MLYEYDDTFEWENGDGMGHYHCDMAQCEDEYIYEMRGIQRERDNNKSKDLKNDTWASLNVMQFRSSDRKVRKREKQLYLPGRWGVYIYTNLKWGLPILLSASFMEEKEKHKAR